jgi:hypothetical protein
MKAVYLMLYLDTSIDLHHLYITQRAMLRNGVQAGEENSS